MTKSIILVDDHAMVRAGLVEIIQRRSDLQVTAQAANAADALRLVAQHPPDLVIVDVSLEVGMNGIELVKHLRTQQPLLPILVLTMHDEDVYAERALAAGATGYLVKRSHIEQLYQAIDRVLMRRVYASDHILDKFLGRSNAKDVHDALSDREIEVLELIGRGLGTREIAASLHLSVKTIETYRANLKAKLAIETAPRLVRYAVQWLESR